MEPDTSDEQSGRRSPRTPSAPGQSDAEFGHRMEAAENETEQFSDVEDLDEEDGNDAERAGKTPPVPNMVAAFAQPVKDEPTH